MKQLIYVFLIALLTVCAIAQLYAQPLDDLIRSEMQKERLPGLAACIIKDGVVVWEGTYGLADREQKIPVTNQTVFNVAGISRLVTATALMQQVEAGRVRLDANVNNYLPFKVSLPGNARYAITPRMLLLQTSSILDNNNMTTSFRQNGPPVLTMETCVENYFKPTGRYYDADWNFLDQVPGTWFSYSNMGMTLAGYMVQEVSGQDLEDACEDKIFQPLGMSNTTFDFSEVHPDQLAKPYYYHLGDYEPYELYSNSLYPAAQMHSTLQDMAHFAIAYMEGGVYDGQRILKTATVQKMLNPSIPWLDERQGLCWYQEAILTDSLYEVWGHTGNDRGTTADLFIHPRLQIGLVVLSNGEGTHEYIMNAMFEKAQSMQVWNSPNVPVTPTETKAYPNPFNSVTTLSLPVEQGKSYRFSLYDMSGKLVRHRDNVATSTMTFERRELPDGIYFFRLSDANGIVTTGRLIIE